MAGKKETLRRFGHNDSHVNAYTHNVLVDVYYIDLVLVVCVLCVVTAASKNVMQMDWAEMKIVDAKNASDARHTGDLEFQVIWRIYMMFYLHGCVSLYVNFCALANVSYLKTRTTF